MGAVEHVVENMQGDEKIDMVGDMIVDLDKNLQVMCTWDSTEDYLKLPPTWQAFWDEVCTNIFYGPLCKLLPNCQGSDCANVTHNCIHGNKVMYTPEDKNILVSFQQQGWVIKIDYQDENGTDDILWHLGNDSYLKKNQQGQADPTIWFSG